MDLQSLLIGKQFLFFKIPYIKVSSVDEYFLLSKKEREWHGFYRTPLSLPLEGFFNEEKEKGWNFFHKQIKKEYPFQYFVREWLPSLDNPIVYGFKKFIGWPLKDFKHAVRLFIKPYYKRWRNVLPRWKYSDAHYLIVESNFALIQDFYHEEVVDGFVDWEADEVHKNFKNKLEEYINWIEVERKVLDDKLSDELTKATKNKVFKDGKLDYYATYEAYHDIEKQIKEKETEILKWMIDNRELFWS